MFSVTEALQKLKERQNLSADETQAVFDAIFAGSAAPETIAALLLGLSEKGETPEEILGAVRSMRANMVPFPSTPGAVDVVGTGGDNLGTLNISTAAAIVVAACGVPVAKHGNRAATSRSGSSDVLRVLGVNLEPEWAALEACMNEAGIVFLFAPRHHPAMKHVAGVRRELGVRTIFNLLGPLTNPANVHFHMIGVYDRKWLQPMAEVLRSLGSERAWFVHGKDGLDEISTTGPSEVVELRENQIRRFMIAPEDFGFPRMRLEDLRGGNAGENALAIHQLFAGKRDAYRDIVLMNAAAALIVAGRVIHSLDGVKLAAEAIDSGAAQKKLDLLINLTKSSAA